MSLIPLLIKGRANCGQLEAFADDCNAMARSFWLGRDVTLANEGGKYVLLSKGDGQTVATRWKECAKSSLKIYPIGGIVAAVIMLAYAITCIPVALAMSVGLAAKTIALHSDPDSKRYQAIAHQYFLSIKQYVELEKLESDLNDKKADQRYDTERLKDCQSMKLIGGRSLSFEIEQMREKERKQLETAMQSRAAEFKSLENQF